MRKTSLKVLSILAKAGVTALVFCYLFSYSALWVDLFNYFPPFFLQYFIASILITLSFIFLKKKNWIIGSLILCCVYGGEVIKANHIGTPMRSMVEAEYQLKILSFNQFRYNQYAGDFLKRVDVQQHDIIIMLEANKSSAEMIEPLKELYPYNFSALGLSSKSMVILSKYPLLELNRQQIDPNDQAKNFLVDFKIKPENTEITTHIYTLHTKAPVPALRIPHRNNELAYITRRIATDKRPNNSAIILAGDLNTTPYNPHFKRLMQRTQLSTAPTYTLPAHSWPSFWPWVMGFQIDHMLISENIYTERFYAFKGEGSDHLALSGRFSIRK